MPKKLSRAELFAQLKDHFSEIGKKGGSAKTAKKQKASRKNAIKYKTEAERKEARLRTMRDYQKRRRKLAKAAKDHAVAEYKHV